MLTDRIGIDLGSAVATDGVGRVVSELGARQARVRFPLAGRARADEAYLSAAHDVVTALVDQRLDVLVVVDGAMTVAPGGLGTFGDPPIDERLAAAWTDELVSNVSRLAERLGDLVRAWEVLPEPNAGQEPLMAPGRWFVLVDAVAHALREASPRATIVAGGLLSDEEDDGVDYLRAALRAPASNDEEPFDEPPFDTIAVRLRVLADGGATEDAVGAALSERVQRLWRVLENHEGTAAATERGIYVTGVGWDADACGEDAQARNAWTALNTLTSESLVRAVFWSALQDGDGTRTGLYRDESLAETSRRPAWKAVHDFSEYARMIAPAAVAASVLLPPAADQETVVPALAVDPESAEDAQDQVAASDTAAVVAAEADGEDDADTERLYTFRIPGAADVLRQQGIEGDELRSVLAAVTKKYGGNQWLPPGEYEVLVLAGSSTPQAAARHTNQHMISAMYRAGGGTWDLLERSGLSLSDLAASRHEPYDGSQIDELTGLDEDERSRVRQELAAIALTEDRT